MDSTPMQVGGLSGPPLRALSTAVLADMYRLTRGQVTRLPQLAPNKDCRQCL
jgi:dihydroorotate dehydrogenase